ncbi:MAG: hypothetical protein NVSMB65_05160 [Chloroflexota bacterium]
MLGLALAAGAVGVSPAGAAAPAAIKPVLARGMAGPLPYVRQTWNNCGPASVSAVLAYWGVARTQGEAQAVLRADGNPLGMGPYGLPSYARSVGLEALLGVGGSAGLLKALISNGFPVIVNQWVSLTDRIRHYRPIESYDDRSGDFTAADPYLGPGLTISYADFGRLWSVSNGRFVVLYPPSRAPLLRRVLVLGGWNAHAAYARDRVQQQRRLATRELDVSTGRDAHAYPYLNLAWDEAQLGHRAAARRALDGAAVHGANPLVLTWIRHELP